MGHKALYALFIAVDLRDVSHFCTLSFKSSSLSKALTAGSLFR
jgi:hypothetical protein